MSTEGGGGGEGRVEMEGDVGGEGDEVLSQVYLNVSRICVLYVDVSTEGGGGGEWVVGGRGCWR